MPPTMKPADVKDGSQIVTVRLSAHVQVEAVRRAALEDRNVSNFINHWLDRTFNEFEIVRQPAIQNDGGAKLQMSSTYGLPNGAAVPEVKKPKTKASKRRKK